MADRRKQEIQDLVRQLREASPVRSVELARRLHQLVEAQKVDAQDTRPAHTGSNKRVAAAAG
jgi:ribosomal protein L1